MTLNARIIALVTPIVGVCVPDLLMQEAGEDAPEEYCTFDYALEPFAGDDEAEELVARVTLRYFAPLKAATTTTRRRLFRAIAESEAFSLPNVQNASDEIGQAYVFTFDALADEVEDG